MSDHKYTNALIHETSPYLLQHAHNPVEWQSWGNEAFSRAKKEDKPILLSIGYSACHWCHVMEKESFENEAIAAVMNRHFINIKVDREERPDLDQVYQNAVQFFIKRGGGWPLTMFLTPEGVPFHGGTYFPPEDRYNLPGFSRVLGAVAKAYAENRNEILSQSAQVLTNLSQVGKARTKNEALPADLVEKSVRSLDRFFDPSNGGFGGAPKFPNTMTHELYFRYYHRSGEASYLTRALLTLYKMGTGGIYDHLGGGFHRYSVDERWLVPHFEKMLYDNAQLVPLYLHGYQLSLNPRFRQIAAETLDYVLREMTSPEGGFYSTQDADSEGVEGKFFVWTLEEIERLLPPAESRIFCRYFGATERGNFEGSNILNIPHDTAGIGREFNLSPEALEEKIAVCKKRLFNIRESRIKPFRDEKILTGWNGLMISAFVEGFRVIGDKRYLSAAEKGVEFIFKQLWRNDKLLAVYKDGKAKLNGYLDDYAFLTAALLDLHEVTFRKEYLEKATALADHLLAGFWDREEGGFYFTGMNHESLISRPKSGYDHSIPSGNGVSARNLVRLHAHTGTHAYRDFADGLFKLYGKEMEENPFGFGSFLCAFDDYRHASQIVLVGGEKEELAPWLDQLNPLYLAGTTLIATTEKETEDHPALKHLSGKKRLGGKTTAYLCRNFTCLPPATSFEALKNLIMENKGLS